MTVFWSSWITIIAFSCWLFILGVLLMVLKFKPEVEEDGTTGHDYDGIREYDKPLPKWWLVIFFGSIAWGIVYWVFFPAMFPGTWHGIATVEVDGDTVPWTSKNELYSELEENNKVFTDNFEKSILAKANATSATETLNELSVLQATMRRSETPPADLKTQIDKKIEALAPAVEKLAQNPSALKVGSRLFLQNCAVCHGSNAKGALGYPNLTDGDWLYGGNASNLLATLHNGRVGGMPAWREQIGEEGVRAASEYVLSLSANNGSKANGELDKTLVAQGSAIFAQNCALCHGKDGKGMISAGAPNLTDQIWLYGGDRETVRNTLRYGRAGVMPQWETKLGNERIMLVVAYVYSLSDRNTKTVKPDTNITASATAPLAAVEVSSAN
ncbi:cytochrome-c oxidase, cbb3-type subunit III [Psychrobacter sp. TAE2020]|uniref:cytochrome-c oxidase, cbb3-type subunit III n=1 Tax=Psychrobacter sp. TAE2020 TaxID=2846762 RepID=UPI001C10748D|nr:cytochrome-c oxidase, cbb3-type subunit III [Psychrobacter sp. TAE2020]MBU5616324.1 cytochrome-c oxidase, cbb3-type subunit III [Psychrobacter sp. TAE2020]